MAVKIDQGEFERSLPKIVACLEEPIASSSIVPMYFVCQRARQDVKVAFIGQGPDELFGGYTRHLGVQYGDLWRGLPDRRPQSLGSAVNRLPRNETLKRGIYSLGVKDRLQRYQHVFSSPRPKRWMDFFTMMWLGRTSDETVDSWSALLPQMEHLDELGGFQILEIRSSLPDELLMYADKLSMAHSLEVRVPYLDRTVVEYAQRLDSSFKIRHGAANGCTGGCVNNYWPLGFSSERSAVSPSMWWTAGSTPRCKANFPEMLLDESSLMFHLLKPKSVRTLLEGHRSGQQDNHKLLFSLVMFEQWLRCTRSDKERFSRAALNPPEKPTIE